MSKRIRDYASSIIIFTLLAVVLTFYYLKYVPEQRAEFNKTAFLELNQIQYALLNKTKALHEALRNIIRQPQKDNILLSGFYVNPANANFTDSDKICSSHFVRDDSLDNWQLRFPVNPVSCKGVTTYSLSKNGDSLLADLISTYKDIFNGYLLINNQDSADVDGPDRGEIIYQSGDLNMSFTVTPDSLLRKKGGLGVQDLQDVTIEGNSYKIFLYPFFLGSQELVLAGLITESNYRNATQKIPFSFFTIIAVLLLLLIIHLPILKIYMLAPTERIRERDIRLIIASYFIAAFFGFFLFTKLFLDKAQAVQNKNNLQYLSKKITGNFQAELLSMSQQLSVFDDTLIKLIEGKEIPRLNALSETPKDSATIADLDHLFKPYIYPYPNNIFWIDSTGKQKARWGFKQALTKAPLINVSDRAYFKDFIKRQPLSIPGIQEPVTVQPTLSKMEGEYVVTVAKKTRVPAYPLTLTMEGPKGKKDSTVSNRPFLIGMSSKMYSIYKVILPPGYGFSIIDEAGQILYDSKPGLPLLANIFNETENSEGIRQSAQYRNTRYFKSTVLRGKDMALLSTPVEGMPYQLLVYYNHFRSDGFEVHLITLSAGLMGLVICLVIFSSLINRWSKVKNRMLESRSPHFEWLHPSANALKQKYYGHLIRWMLLLLGIYILSWFLIETLATGSEFSLLFISMLFPFYIAIFYYELRERYYDVQERKTDINWYYARPSIVLRGVLLIIIILINCFTTFVKFSFALAFPVLLAQILWVTMIALSTFRFRYFMMKANGQHQQQHVLILKLKKFTATLRSGIMKWTKPGRQKLFTIATYRYGQSHLESGKPAGQQIATQHADKERPTPKFKIPLSYIWSILIGVVMISIIPASGIFWLFFREETGIYLNSDQLSISKDIDQRAETINKKIREFKFNPKNPTDSLNIGRLKFEHGIYLVSGRASADSLGAKPAPLQYPTYEFIQLHDQFFPTDSLVMDWIGPTYSAADNTWNFTSNSLEKSSPELLYRKRRDGINPGPFRLTLDANTSRTTMGLMTHSFSGTGTAFSIFFIVALCFSLAIAYFLTLSLTKRIFLVELEQVTSMNDKTTITLATTCYNKNDLRPALQKMITETCKDWDIISLDPSKNNIAFTDPEFPRLIDIYYFEKKLPVRVLENKMPWLVDKLEPVYSELWNSLTISQKFILYDFALDGFTNYKAGKDLQVLISGGLLFFDDLRLSPMTLSFQEYVLGKKEDPVLNEYLLKTAKEDTWKKFKSPLLIVLTALGIFVFLTQQEVYQKITGLLAAITTLLPMLSGLLNKSNGKTDGA